MRHTLEHPSKANRIILTPDSTRRKYHQCFRTYSYAKHGYGSLFYIGSFWHCFSYTAFFTLPYELESLVVLFTCSLALLAHKVIPAKTNVGLRTCHSKYQTASIPDVQQQGWLRIKNVPGASTEWLPLLYLYHCSTVRHLFPFNRIKSHSLINQLFLGFDDGVAVSDEQLPPFYYFNSPLSRMCPF